MHSPQRKFIFHIEDDEDDQLMFKEAVHQIDPAIELWSARNGQEGLDVLTQFSLLNNLPALIVLDLNLPGMDGKSVLMELKKHTILSNVPLAIFSTSSSELDRLFAIKQGVKMFTKPSKEHEFFTIVKDMLETCMNVYLP